MPARTPSPSESVNQMEKETQAGCEKEKGRGRWEVRPSTPVLALSRSIRMGSYDLTWQKGR